MKTQPVLVDDVLAAFSFTMPFVRTSPTSKAAAIKAVSRTHIDRVRLLDYLRKCGQDGATDEEMQLATGICGDRQRPRRGDLDKRGLIRKNGLTRTTLSGNQAAVWVAA